MQVEEWDIRGRIAVRVDNESGSGSLYWTQQKDEYNVRVITPFGGGTYQLTGDSNTALLRNPDNRVMQAENAEALFQQQAGWYLPVSGLVYWVRGLPMPALQVDELLLDEENRLSALNQAGWSIRYKNYIGINGKSMPGRLDLQNNRIRVRMSIREWNLP